MEEVDLAALAARSAARPGPARSDRRPPGSRPPRARCRGPPRRPAGPRRARPGVRRWSWRPGTDRRSDSPSAAPGRMAWAMASPVRLRRRSIRITPTGVAAERQGQTTHQRSSHEAELDKGADDQLQDHGPARSARRQNRRLRRRARASAGHESAARRCRTSAVGAPGDRLAGQQQGLREVGAGRDPGRGSRPPRSVPRRASAAPGRSGPPWCAHRRR